MNLDKDLKSSILEIPEKYREIIFIYEKNPELPILIVESCLKVSQLLQVMIHNGYNTNFYAFSSGAAWADKSVSVDLTLRNAEKTFSPVAIADVSSWLMKAWTGLHLLSIDEQMSTLSEMTLLMQKIGFKRKQAFFLHRWIKTLLNSPKYDGKAAMYSIQQLCELIGLSFKECKDDFQRDTNRIGWISLQILVLRECIHISELNQDHYKSILFITQLLKKMVKNLSVADQSILSEKLQSVVLKHTDDVSNEMDAPIMTGVPILLNIIAIEPPLSKLPIVHSTKELEKQTKNVFIYNPFSKQDNTSRNILLIQGELAQFELTLGNPFSFELDIQSISLNTSGIQFKPISSSVIIPANTKSHTINVSGTAMESGILVMHGCHVKMLGGCIEEELFLYNNTIAPFIREKERLYGNMQLVDSKQHPSQQPLESNKTQKQQCQVLPVQPYLQMQDSVQTAFMLFQGELNSMEICFENISNEPVNYISITFLEDMVPESSVCESPEDIYERDVYNHQVRVFWVESIRVDQKTVEHLENTKDSIVFGPIKTHVFRLELAPKSILYTRIGMFGKQGSIGGMMILEYANIQNEMDTVFYTRQVRIPLALTTYSALNSRNMDIVSHFIPVPQNELSDDSKDEHSVNKNQQNTDTQMDLTLVSKKDVSYFTFDVHNAWNTVFEISWDIYGDVLHGKEPTFSFKTVLHGGENKRYPMLCVLLIHRVVLPLPFLHLSDTITHSRIPSPEWKQFVVTKSSKLSPQQLYSKQLCFWYKEAVIGGLIYKGMIIGKWKSVSFFIKF